MRCLAILVCALSALSHGTARFQLKPIVSGLSEPIACVQDPARPNVNFIVEQRGKIRVLIDKRLQATALIDLAPIIQHGGEQGLLGLAFPADFATSKYFYVNMTVPGPAMQVSRFQLTSTNPFRASLVSRHDVLQTPRLHGNHNGGAMQFGPDGYLYIGTGDGGSSGDPDGNGQDPLTLLGKMLRIDPSGDDFPLDPKRNYRIPVTNPFLDGQPISALGEIWSFGLRNPFKFCFDDPRLNGTGALIIGDVGQGAFEEINYEPLGGGGRNYGWKRFEGEFQFSTDPLAFGPDTKPAYAYGHNIGRSVIGGPVYRGLRLGPGYFGKCFFADFSESRIFAGSPQYDAVSGRWKIVNVVDLTNQVGQRALGSPSSIDLDSNGDILVVDYAGRVSQLVRAESTWITAFSLVAGLDLSGPVRSLVTIDDRAVSLRSTQQPTRLASIQITGITNHTLPAKLVIKSTGKISRAIMGTLKIYARRWSDGAFILVKQSAIDSVQRSYQSPDLPASNYIRQRDGRIEARVEVTLPSNAPSDTRVTWNATTFFAS